MISIIYFLEDRMQESFIISLVNRIAGEYKLTISNEVFSASGGSGAVLNQLKKFVKTLEPASFDLLVVSIDGNCKGTFEKERQIMKNIPENLKDKTICCIPDPHIERWYLLDLHALKKAIEYPVRISPPPQQKCKKDYYKNILGEALKPVGTLLGGAEYAEKVVENLDLQLVKNKDKGFQRFLDELTRQFIE